VHDVSARERCHFCRFGGVQSLPVEAVAAAFGGDTGNTNQSITGAIATGSVAARWRKNGAGSGRKDGAATAADRALAGENSTENCIVRAPGKWEFQPPVGKRGF